MKLNFSIRSKLILVVFSSLIFVGVGETYIVVNLRNSYNKLFELQKENTTVENVISESFLLFGNTSVTLDNVLIGVDDLESLRESEALFNAESLKLKILLDAFINGSESEAFKKVSGGLIYKEWLRNEDFRKFGKIPRLSNSHLQTVGEWSIYFGAYGRNADNIFSLERTIIRLGNKGEEAILSQEELKKEIFEAREHQMKIAELMKNLLGEQNVDFEKRSESVNTKLKNQIVAGGTLLNVLLLTISILALAVIFKEIVGPIADLSRVSREIASGKLKARGKESGNDEIGILTRNFNQMIESLARDQETLEARVEERTQDLKEETDKANSIINSTADGLFVIDREGKFVLVNPAAEKITKYKREELIAKKITVIKLLKGNRELKEEERPFSNVITTGKPFTVTVDDDYSLERADGVSIPITIDESPLSGNGVTGVVIAFRDVTIEKESKSIIEEKVKEKTAQLSASINSLSFGFILADNTGTIIMRNSSARLLIGEEIKGKKLSDVEKIVGAKIDLIKHAEASHRENRLIECDNCTIGQKIIHTYFTPVVSEATDLGTVILMEDITEKKVLDRARDEFFSIASHELRTPLTAIMGNTSLIEEYFSAKLKDKELKEMIDDVKESAERLIRIVDDFLNVSRLEMGKIEFKKENVDLKTLAQNVIKELGPQAAQKGIALEIESPKSEIPKAKADSARAEEVLINLVGNAIKYSDKGEIKIGFAPENGTVKVSVSDTGKGIAPENEKLLFHKFQQAGSSIYTRDTTQGTGLGLYISRLMVEGMGGKVWLEKTQVDKGSVFAFSLPVAAK